MWKLHGDRMEEEIRSRIGKAARVIWVLNELPVWRQKEPSRKTKLRVYNATVVPMLPSQSCLLYTSDAADE